MTEVKGLPVAGYRAQTEERLAEVNRNKETEERILRELDRMLACVNHGPNGGLLYDPRWVQIARTHIEQGFMAMNRAVFQPERVRLPEDPPEA